MGWLVPGPSSPHLMFCSSCPACLQPGGMFSVGIRRLSLWIRDAERSGGLISAKTVFILNSGNTPAFSLPELQTHHLPGSSSSPSLGRRVGRALPALQQLPSTRLPLEAEKMALPSHSSLWGTGKAVSGEGGNHTSRTKATNTAK